MATVDIKRPSSLSRTEPFSKRASTAFAAKTLVSPNEVVTTGADDNTFTATTATSQSVLGVNIRPIESTDSDYADETKVPILMDEFADYEFSVGTGTAVVTDEQAYIDLDNATEVDVDASSIDAIFVTNFVSGTKIRGKITLWSTWNPPQMRG